MAVAMMKTYEDDQQEIISRIPRHYYQLRKQLFSSSSLIVLQMMSLLLLLIVLNCHFCSAWVCNSNHHGQRHSISSFAQQTRLHTTTSSTSTSTTSTPKANAELTDRDEEVLFGDDNNGETLYPSEQERSKDIYGNILNVPHRHNNGDNDSYDINDLDHVPNEPLINKLRTMRTTKLQNCPQLWYETKHIMPVDQRAIYDRHHCDTEIDMTYEQVYSNVDYTKHIIKNLLNSNNNNNNSKQLKLKEQKHIALFAENSAYWLLLDHGIQKMRGVSAVRGSDAPIHELQYIYKHCDSYQIAILQDYTLLNKLYLDTIDNRRNNNNPNYPPLGFTNELYGPVQNIILIHRGRKNQDNTIEKVNQIAKELNINIYFFNDLLNEQKEKQQLSSKKLLLNNNEYDDDDIIPQKNDLATIVYTSGTTGYPKGVMLTHGNLLHQLTHRLFPTKQYIDTEPLPNETMVSLLPVWHITERTFELWMLSRGCNVVYSSIRTFKKDLAIHQPQWMVLVPRVLEKIALGVQEKFSTSGMAVKQLSKLFTNIGQLYIKHLKIINGLIVGDSSPSIIERLTSKTIVTSLTPLHSIGQKIVWSKVRDGFGGKLKVIISGGSALASGLESFYEIAGLQILVGYGLTECSPLLTYRRGDSNLVTGGCTGKPCTDTEIRVVAQAADTPTTATTTKSVGPRPALPHGQIGLVLGKGPQIMKGYYKDIDATNRAIDQYGWFDTGDLGRINAATGDLILTGRAKDTIVLSNGENVEPVPIEDAILGNIQLVEQVMITSYQDRDNNGGSSGDGKSLIAVIVLNPQELYDLSLLLGNNELSPTLVKEITDAKESINSPKCTLDEYNQLMNDVIIPISERIINNNNNANKNSIQQYLITNVKDILTTKNSNFRKWEIVKDFIITFEPFCMINGQLTQSYKVKRPAVYERYHNDIKQLLLTTSTSE